MEYATQKEVRHHKEHIKDTIEHLEFYLDCAKNMASGPSLPSLPI